MRCFRTSTLFFCCVSITGCVTNSVALFTRGAVPSADMTHKSIAVMPIVSHGRDPSGAVAAQQAADRLFAGTIGDVSFFSPDRTIAALDNPAQTLAEIRQGTAHVLSSAAVEPADTDARTLLASDAIGDSSPVMTISEGEPALGEIFPAFVSPELFSGIDTDYVLCSATAPRYIEIFDIMAIFGILPIAYFVEVGERHPFAVFGLYDRRSGQRVWESHIGSTILSRDARYQDIDPRAAPVVGAAYILTGRAEDVLGRALGVTPAIEEKPQESVQAEQALGSEASDSSATPSAE